MTPTSLPTLLEALIQKLRGCNIHGDAEEPPVAILWTDPRSEWRPLITLLRQQLPELLCLGDYDPEDQQGPALWLRCIVDACPPLQTKTSSEPNQAKCCCLPMASAMTWPDR
jgi:hypothetical protein